MNGNQGEQQVVSVPANSSVRSSKEKYKNVLYNLGIAEIIIGSLSVILGIAVVCITAYWFNSRDGNYFQPYSVSGIFCGAFGIVVGTMGVKARSNPSMCMYNANMALSIIGANGMTGLCVVSAMAAAFSYLRITSLIIIYSILTVLGFVGLVIFIIHSAYCCAGVCCKPNQGAAAPYHPSAAGMQQPQLVQLANGQYVLAPPQAPFSPYAVASDTIVVDATSYRHSSLTEQPSPSVVNINTLQASASVSQQATDSIPTQGVQSEQDQETDDDLPLIL